MPLMSCLMSRGGQARILPEYWRIGEKRNNLIADHYGKEKNSIYADNVKTFW